MPMVTPCCYPGCPVLLDGVGSYCPEHKRKRQHRPSSAERGYDNVWRRCRDGYIQEHPVCEGQYVCNGMPAEEVDHIVPIEEGGERLDHANLQSLCGACHKHKTYHMDKSSFGGV